MGNIDIKLILDEVFGKSCDNIACDTCKYKEDCELINKFINDIKDKGLSPDQYVRGLALFIYVLKEQNILMILVKLKKILLNLLLKMDLKLIGLLIVGIVFLTIKINLNQLLLFFLNMLKI